MVWDGPGRVQRWTEMHADADDVPAASGRGAVVTVRRLSESAAEPAHRGSGTAVGRGSTSVGAREFGAPGGEAGERRPPATRREPAG